MNQLSITYTAIDVEILTKCVDKFELFFDGQNSNKSCLIRSWTTKFSRFPLHSTLRSHKNDYESKIFNISINARAKHEDDKSAEKQHFIRGISFLIPS